MAIDIWPVWSCPDGTPDIIKVRYDDEEFSQDLINSQADYPDEMVMINIDKIVSLRRKWAHDTKISDVLDYWIATMKERGQSFIRVVINE